MKKITWRQVEVPKSTLAEWLTEKNFQPGKFHVVQHQFSSDRAIVVYVEKEE